MIKSKKFWSYQICESQTLSDEILKSFKSKGKISDDITYLFEHLSSGVHPSLKKITTKETSSLIFNNVLIDQNTLKILFHILPSTKIVSLKFSTNYLTHQNLQYLLTSLLTKENSVYNLSFEWNDKIIVNGVEYSFKDINSIAEEQVINEIKKIHNLFGGESGLIATDKLEALTLRGNFLGDDAAIKIFESLKKNSCMRVLNLFKNDISDKSMTTFGEMMLVNKVLEEINLGGNYLSDFSMKIFCDNSGKVLLSEEEFEEYNKLLKEKNEIIKKNEKLKKGESETPVPQLDEVESTEEGNFKVKNTTLKDIILIQNNFTDKCYDNLIELLKKNKGIKISINLKSFSDKQKRLFDDMDDYEMRDRIYLLK